MGGGGMNFGTLGGGVGGFLVGGPAGAVVGSMVGNEVGKLLDPQKPNIKASGAEKELKRMAAETYAAGAPIRNQYLTEALSLLRGGDITDLPGYATQMALGQRAIGNAFGQARENILENAPVGNQGAVLRGVENAATATAEAKGRLANQIAESMLNNYLGNAFGLASGGMTAGLQGMGNAANVAASRAAAQAQAEAAANQNRTNMIGTLGNLYLGGAGLYAGK